MHINVLLLTWNGLRFLPDLFESLDKQTYKNFTLRICDNGSTDGTIEYLREYRTKDLVLANNKNIGYAPGYNALYKFTVDHLAGDEEEILLLLNQDIILANDTLEKLVVEFKKDEKVGSVQPKLFKAFAEQMNEELEEKTKSDILDSVGLVIRRDWRFYEKGAGEMDNGQYDNDLDIFGVNGALAAYRLKAVQESSIDGNLFEERYFAYREDCDLAWRMRKVGWDARFAPEVRAHHYRGMYGAYKSGLFERLKNRRGQRPIAAALSLRNEIYTMIRNLDLLTFLRYSPFIFFQLGGRIVYAFIFESLTRKELLKIPGQLSYLIKCRKKIKEMTVVDNNQLMKYVERT